MWRSTSLRKVLCAVVSLESSSTTTGISERGSVVHVITTPARAADFLMLYSGLSLTVATPPRTTKWLPRYNQPTNQPTNQLTDATTPAGGSSVGGGNHGSGTASVIVQRAAVEVVEMFVGDFVPKPRPPDPQDPVASGLGGGGKEGQNAGKAVSKMSKWAAIGRAGKLSARATAVCAQEVRARMSWSMGTRVWPRQSVRMGVGGVFPNLLG